ncbi:uncharacterized protein G2W53_004293 [Senna tora]|uniref:Uncharacterized protein n=1 Tax=Senna tora TaxID=362788 RepID=A0A835CJ80_9FABA|nr:uncharacterized protein G2W53_004293 [Senna tora]
MLLNACVLVLTVNLKFGPFFKSVPYFFSLVLYSIPFLHYVHALLLPSKSTPFLALHTGLISAHRTHHRPCLTRTLPSPSLPLPPSDRERQTSPRKPRQGLWEGVHGGNRSQAVALNKGNE